MAEPFADFIDDSDNPAVLRVAAVPIAAVSGAVGAVGGAAVGVVGGVAKGTVSAVKGIGSAIGNIFG